MSGHSAGPNDSGYRRAGIADIAERGDHHIVLGKVIDSRVARAPAGRPDAAIGAGRPREVILALSATVDGQTTAHYIAERLAGLGVTISRLAHGVPVGGELDYLDDGTLSAALKARRPA